MAKKMKLHPLSEVLTVGKTIENHGAFMSAIGHAMEQEKAGHYTGAVTAFTDVTDPATGVLTRSISWTITPTDPGSHSAPAPALPTE